MTKEELEISAKDDVSSDDKSQEDKGKAAVNVQDSDEGAKKEDPLMNASDVINSMRNALGEKLESIRNIEPPMPYYTRPKQRQYWGDVQVAPHKEWGDIFFDLFYVAGAYNLGNMLREEPTKRGIFYFAATFFPIQSLWQYKMYYDSRFYTGRDMFHQLYELCVLVVLATAVLHIRPVSLLSNPEEHQDLFILVSSITAGMILIMGRSLEVYFMIENEPPAKIASKRDAIMYLFMTLFFAAATIYAGIKHYGYDEQHGSDSYYDSAYGGSSYHQEESYTHDPSHHDAEYDVNATNSNATSSEYNQGDHHFLFRLLAGASDYGDTESSSTYSGDAAMALLLVGFCANHLVWFLVMLIVIPWQGGGDHRSVTVPMNIDYAIHRYGEWIMLMLGETVLSLLIVGVYNVSEYYKTIYCGILSISLLQIMHFRSQPHHADDHAMRRKKERGYAYVILIQLYSAALIMLGASYKMLLYEYVYQYDESGYEKESSYATDSGYGTESAGYGDDSGYGSNETDTAYGTESSYHADDGHRRLMVFASKLHRWLAGGGGGGALRFDKADREQRVANLFCGSMAAVWFLCDLLVLVHRGIKENMQRCKETPVPKLVKLLGIPLLLARIGLVVFMATLPLYETDPSFIAFLGLAGIVVQVVLRVIGTTLYHEDHEEDEYQEILKHGLAGEKSMAFQMDEDSENDE